MPKRIINFDLDFADKDVTSKFRIKQLDTPQLVITANLNGSPYSISGAPRFSVAVEDEAFTQTSGITLNGNTITVNTEKGIFGKGGMALGELEVVDSEGTTTSMSFTFVIEGKISEGANLPTDIEGFVARYERMLADFKSKSDNLISTSTDTINHLISSSDSNVKSMISSANDRVDSKLSQLQADYNSTKEFTVNELNIAKEQHNKDFERMTSSQQQDAEVILARGDSESLREELERIEYKSKEIWESVEGSFLILNNTNLGWMQNIIIEGNSWQDPNDLSIIKSVGDKVEGQNLYKVPLLCTSENIFNGAFERGSLNTSDGSEYNEPSVVDIAIRSGFVEIQENEKISLKSFPNFNPNLYFYDKDKNFITMATTPTNITPSNAKFLRFRFLSTDLNLKTVLRYGELPAEYQEYQEHQMNISLPCQLEKGDRLLGDKVEKNTIKEYLTDFSTMNVREYNNPQEPTTYKTFMVDFNYNKSLLLRDMLYINFIISNKFKKHKAFCWDVANGEVGLFAIHDELNNIYFNMSTTTTVEEAKEYIKDMFIIGESKLQQYYDLPQGQKVALRTFAPKTNISFGCEIEGVIKGEVPKSTQASIQANTKAIEVLDKELEKVKRLEEATTSTVVMDGDFQVVEETSQGYFSDVKVEGRTLVNLTKYTYSYWGNGSSFAYRKIDTSLLQVGETYTVKLININSNLSQFVIGEASASNPYFPKQIIGEVTFECPKVSSQYNLFVYPKSGYEIQDSDLENIEILIIKGDKVGEMPTGYFEGMLSAGEDVDEIEVSSTWGEGNLCEFTPFTTTNIATKVGGFNVVMPNDIERIYYKVVADNEVVNSGNIALQFRDKQDANIVEKTLNTITNYIDVQKGVLNNCEKIGLYYNANYGVHKIQELVISRMPISDSTIYKADKKRILYLDPTDNTYKKPILREWDTIEKHSDGKYYYHKRSGQDVFNRSKGFKGLTINGDFVVAYCDSPNTYKQYAKGLIVDKLSFGGNVGYQSEIQTEGFFIASNNVGASQWSYVSLHNSKLNTPTLEGINAWLDNNNIKVVYPLAKEEIYECLPLDLITYEGSTILVNKSGALNPVYTFHFNGNIANVVAINQKSISNLQNEMADIRNMFKMVLAGDMQSLAYTLYPEAFEENNHPIATLPLEPM